MAHGWLQWKVGAGDGCCEHTNERTDIFLHLRDCQSFEKG